MVKRDVVKYELAAMKSRAALMDAMGAVVKGQVSFTDHLTDRATALYSTSRKQWTGPPAPNATRQSRAAGNTVKSGEAFRIAAPDAWRGGQMSSARRRAVHSAGWTLSRNSM